MSGPVVVDVTSEVRWFSDGPLPPELVRWFDPSGTGLVEDRCDTYRLDRQLDTGVKRRFGTILELKRRLGAPEPITVAGMTGQLELWKRWSPAIGQIQVDDPATWVDVDKAVVKRRFDADGREVQLSERGRPMTGDGCEAELAAISVNASPTWTFALAAFGDADRHRALLTRTWEALVDDRADIAALWLASQRSCGYPEWLAGLASAPVS